MKIFKNSKKKKKKIFFLVQQDVYEGEPSETQDDNNEIDGSFEVVPGVTADEYIKRFSTIEVSNPTDRRNFRIRVPPAPETFYDIGKDAQKIYCLIFYVL